MEESSNKQKKNYQTGKIESNAPSPRDSLSCQTDGKFYFSCFTQSSITLMMPVVTAETS